MPCRATTEAGYGEQISIYLISWPRPLPSRAHATCINRLDKQRRVGLLRRHGLAFVEFDLLLIY